MRIALIGPNLEENLSLRYLASSLDRGGYDAEVLTFNDEREMGDVLSAARGYDIVGLSLCFQVRAGEFFELARGLKRSPGPLVVAGGHFATSAPVEILTNHPEIDLLVLHEGENTMVEIADALSSNRPLSEIPGIVFREEGRIVASAKRDILRDLDALPLPDRSGPTLLQAGVPTAYLLGSRGCLSNCDYCCISTLHRSACGPKFRQRKPDRIAAEMADLYHRRGIRQFIFHDDNFLVPSVSKNHTRLDQLESGLEARGVTDPIGLVIKCRPSEVDRGVLRRLKAMGLLRVFLGVESASQSGLRAIGRKQTVQESEAALATLRSLGISTQFTVMTFHPDATADTLETDLDFLERHLDDPFNICRTEIYAGTPLLSRMQAEGRVRGSYMAYHYVIEDPAVQRASELSVRLLRERCWRTGGLMNSAIGFDHLAAVVARFYGDEGSARRLIEAVADWKRAVNRSTIDLLRELVDIAALQERGSDVDDRLHRFIETERRSRLALGEECKALRRQLDDVVLRPSGLKRDERSQLIPFVWPSPKNLARHAAAVLLAFSTTACDGPWVSETAPDPLYDGDGDQLTDNCEEYLFGTNPSVVDSDGDGIPDGEEDHDNDGLTNLEEQKDNLDCVDVVNDGGVEKDGGE